MPPHRRLAGLLPFALASLLACGRGAPPGGEAVALPPDAPRLILLVVIDQGGADEIDRLRPLLHGGLGRLLDESARFTDAHQDHALTETAPGHATIATGRFPSGHGIVANGWIDPETGDEVYAVDDPEHGTSPVLMLASGLGDWLHAAVPRSKVFALGGKDRSAVTLGGATADGVFWSDWDTGRFETSDYYPEAPDWLERFHDASSPDERFGAVWEPLPEVAAAAGSFGFDRPDWGDLDPELGFPHPLGDASPAPTEAFYQDFGHTPFADTYLERLAATLLTEEHLGEDAAPDLLAISFSALDAVGHHYGPDSMEYADALVRLDGDLDDLLERIDRGVGLDRTLVVVSADHGVHTAPEVAARRGEPGRRIGAPQIRCVQGLEGELDRRFGDGDWLRSGPFFDPDTLLARRVAREEVESAAREYLEACPDVARVVTRTEIESAEADDDPVTRLYRRSYRRGRSPDLFVLYDPGFLDAGITTAASHGTPYPYDTHVPWLVRGARIAARDVPGRVTTADLAPTIASLVGIPIPDDLDGIDRSPVLRPPPAP